MFESVVKIIKEILSDKGAKLHEEITSESKLRDLGLSSFDMATLTVMIEDEYDVDVFENGIVYTVGEVVDAIEKKS